MQNGNREDLRFAILRVIVEAKGDGVLDEDMAEAVAQYIDADEESIDDEVRDLFACDLIGRDDPESPWQLTDEALR